MLERPRVGRDRWARRALIDYEGVRRARSRAIHKLPWRFRFWIREAAQGIEPESVATGSRSPR
jgi:hypothetical protein